MYVFKRDFEVNNFKISHIFFGFFESIILIFHTFLKKSTVGRCTDPRTPGGAVQEVKSYEAGQLLRFRCLRSGYEPVPSAPLMCQQGVNISEWNSTLPLCTGELKQLYVLFRGIHYFISQH